MLPTAAGQPSFLLFSLAGHPPARPGAIRLRMACRSEECPGRVEKRSRATHGIGMGVVDRRDF
ncbi:MAG: hypothetical protein RDU89_05320 [bacterium]|nr:hypothetical protein [bacterium]